MLRWRGDHCHRGRRAQDGLLQAGVDITVIALWLGHASPTTTHGYVEADLEHQDKVESAAFSPTTSAP